MKHKRNHGTLGVTFTLNHIEKLRERKRLVGVPLSVQVRIALDMYFKSLDE